MPWTQGPADCCWASLGESPLNFPIICGDWSVGYEITRIGELRMIRDEITRPGYVRFYIKVRWGGILMVNDALKAAQR